jgi:hypothetical protein
MKNGSLAIIVRSYMGDYHLKKSAYSKATRECNKDGKILFVAHEYKTNWDTLYLSFRCLLKDGTEMQQRPIYENAQNF